MFFRTGYLLRPGQCGQARRSPSSRCPARGGAGILLTRTIAHENILHLDHAAKEDGMKRPGILLVVLLIGVTSLAGAATTVKPALKLLGICRWNPDPAW